MIAIVDYGMGNIRSVANALGHLGAEFGLVSDPAGLKNADGVILPGVGAFGDAMTNLKKSGMDAAIHDIIAAGVPFLGICLGQQLLFESSEESPGIAGLGIIAGKCLRIPADCGVKVPHIGWNSLDMARGRLFDGVAPDTYVYFVHSYYTKAENESDVSARTHYGADIDAALEKGNVFATQFHPEKSGEAGLAILRNFLNVTRKGA